MAETESSPQPTSRGNLITRGISRLFGRGEKTPVPTSVKAQKDLNLEPIELTGDEKLEIEERSKTEAPRLKQMLDQFQDGRCLILTVGPVAEDTIGKDTPNFTDSHHGLVAGITQTSYEAIKLYEEFRKLAPEERVVLVVDEQLPNDRPSDGIEIASLIIKLSEENSWEKPQVIGISTVKRDLVKDRSLPMGFRMNDAVGDLSLGYFLGQYYERRNNLIFEAIRENISFNEVERRDFQRRTKAREKAENQSKQPPFEAGLKLLEHSGLSAFTKKAKEALSELRELSGKRFFVLIIDDSYSKVVHVQESAPVGTERQGISCVIRYEEDGNRGIVLYEEFAKLAPGERVIVFMDGNLKGDDNGPMVTQRLLSAAGRLNLPKPSIVGFSSDEDKNESIQEVNPEIYLGSYFGHERRYEPYKDIFEIISSKI